jgi:hypothetical protein
MSSTATVERIEARAHITMANSARMRENILRHPRSPRAVERAWRVIAGIRGLIAWAEPEHLESMVLAEQSIWLITELLQLSHTRVSALLKLAAERGHSSAPWFRALADALEDLGDTLEALYLSRDPEMRAAIEAAGAELTAVRAARPEATGPDWRAALAKMSG